MRVSSQFVGKECRYGISLHRFGLLSDPFFRFWGCFVGFDEVKMGKGKTAWATERFTTAVDHAYAALCFQLQASTVLLVLAQRLQQGIEAA